MHKKDDTCFEIYGLSHFFGDFPINSLFKALQDNWQGLLYFFFLYFSCIQNTKVTADTFKLLPLGITKQRN